MKLEKNESKDSIVRNEKTLRKLIMKSAKSAIPVAGKSKSSVKWWNEELNKQKKELYRTRRKYQNSRKKMNMDQLAIIEARNNYYRSKKEYDKNIYETRTKCWKEFITGAKNDTWGFAYKMCSGKLRIQTIMSSIRWEGQETIDWRDSANMLLQALFPVDDDVDDKPAQEEIRNEVKEAYISSQQERDFTEEEVDMAIKNVRVGKAPGWDNMEVIILKEAWPHLRAELLELYNGCLKFGIFPKA